MATQTINFRIESRGIEAIQSKKRVPFIATLQPKRRGMFTLTGESLRGFKNDVRPELDALRTGEWLKIDTFPVNLGPTGRFWKQEAQRYESESENIGDVG